MAKVKTVQNSRKEFRCSKCGGVIEKGSEYKSITLYRKPTQRFHRGCGIPRSATTSSEYLKAVWDATDRLEEQLALAENFELMNMEDPEECITGVISDMENLRDEMEEKVDNLRDSWGDEAFEGNDIFRQIEERKEALDECISELESIDFDDTDLDQANDHSITADSHETTRAELEDDLNELHGQDMSEADDDEIEEWEDEMADLQEQIDSVEGERDDYQDMYNDCMEAITEAFSTAIDALNELENY